MITPRIEENNKKLQQSLRFTHPDDINKGILSVLTDISETLALLTDTIAMIYGREIRTNDQKGGQGNEP